MPDSFARNGKMLECDSKTYKKPTMSDGYLRVDEINYALKKIKEMDWFNGHLVLMGHSQGAWALTRSPIENVAGIVLSSLESCQMINMSSSVPIHRAGYEKDPWSNISPLQCDSHMVKNNFSMNIVSGVEHETYYSPELRRSIIDFIGGLNN